MNKPSRGGTGRGQGRKPLPLSARAEKHSITLSVDVADFVRDQQRDGETFSAVIARLLSEHPRFSPDVKLI